MIPQRLLPQTVTYEPYIGSGQDGDVYGDPITVPARVQFQNKLVRNAQRQEVVSAATVYMQPHATPPIPGSLVTLPGDTWPRVVIAYALTAGARQPELLTVELA